MPNTVPTLREWFATCSVSGMCDGLPISGKRVLTPKTAAPYFAHHCVVPGDLGACNRSNRGVDA